MCERRYSAKLGPLCLSLPVLWLTSVDVATAEDPRVVSVDCARAVEGPLHLWGHVNVSRRAPPPVEFCGHLEREFGRPEVTRCWLMLDQAWDYRTDTYRFNYEINKDYYEDDPNKKRYGVPGVTTGLCYHDYLDSVGAHSDTVMLNIRRYEQEVLTGMLSYEKWKEVFKTAVGHYKERCPNLRYIEVLNEPTARNQSNLGKIDRYYGFYRRAYEAINELNDEMRFELPLLVGGNSGFRTGEAIHLIRDFARDENPRKKLDFVSFHHYWIAKTPAELANWEEEIDDALKRASLGTDLPIFVTEIGYAHPWDDPKKNLWQAAGMTAFQYQVRHARNLRLFPWVQFHSLKQIAFVQFDPSLRMTPFGAAVKMLRMHKKAEVAATSPDLDKNGNGLGALATLDETGLVVELWNLRPGAEGRNNAKGNDKNRGSGTRQVEVSITNLPKHLHEGTIRIRRYLIDSKHSNCLSMPNSPGGLEMVDQRTQPGAAELRLSASMEPMALCLWTIEPAASPSKR